MNELTAEEQASIAAASLLLGREMLPEWHEWPQTTAEILALTGANETQAIEALGRLRELLPTLADPPSQSDKTAVMKALLNYAYHHPYVGLALTDETDPEGHDHYCRFVLGLAAPGQPGEKFSLVELASLSHIPLDALKKKVQSTD